LGWRTIAHWVVVAGALGYLAWQIPEVAGQFAHVGAQVDHVRWGWVIAAAVSGVAALAAYGELQRQVLLVGGVRLTVATAQGINFAQNAVSSTVPVVGGAGSLGYAINQLRHRGVDAALAAWSVLLTGMITTVTLLVLGFLGLAWAGRIPRLVGTSGAAVVAFGSAGVWLLVTHPAILRRGLHVFLRMGHRTPGVCIGCRRNWADRADSVAGRLSAKVACLRPGGWRWTALISVALLSWALDFLTLVASAAATDITVPWAVLAVGFLVVQGTVALQILPGGAGLAEAGLLGVLLGFGVAATPAAVTVLVYRVISWLGLSLVGWVVYALQPHATPMHQHDTGASEPTAATAVHSVPAGRVPA
jgi:uncharacterized membrane protein YbhN (UPF0104 family)